MGMGDGQMLPRQTKRTETGFGVESVMMCGLESVEGMGKGLWLRLLGVDGRSCGV
jgi:hypothetical protein